MSEQLENRTALVTGGSGGMGEDFARELAARGADVVLVARTEDKLENVADAIESDFDVDAEWVSMDLARPEAAEELYEEVSDRDLVIDILVNNAGFGVFGEFLECDWNRHEALINLDVITPVRLSYLFADDMIDRGWGRLLQVASIGSFQPTPTYATYTGAKAFLENWGVSFDYELAGTGVSSTVICPGVTKTGFFDRAGQETTLFQRMSMMDSEKVAAIGVKAMLKQRMSIIPGFLNALMIWMTTFIPRRMERWIGYLTMRNE